MPAGAYVEFRFDHAAVRAFGYHRGIGLCPEKQGQCPQKYGFACSGLPGYDDKTLRERDVQRVYQNVILYVQGAEHSGKGLFLRCVFLGGSVI